MKPHFGLFESGHSRQVLLYSVYLSPYQVRPFVEPDLVPKIFAKTSCHYQVKTFIIYLFSDTKIQNLVSRY